MGSAFAGNQELSFWQSRTGTFLSLEEAFPDLSQVEVLIWGEEHDDALGHEKQLEFLTKLHPKFSLILSLEMLERDQQEIVQDYLSGAISEKSFLSTTVHWNNFAKDYLPLIRFAKENSLPVVAANPPRRYVNAIARKGLSAYRDFSKEALAYLPPAYSLNQFVSPSYQERLRSIFSEGSHGGSESMILAQHTWDQGMAESISRAIFQTGRKVLHFQGRFHSDYNGGVAYRLRSMGHSVVVLTALPEESSSLDPEIADFVILTRSR